MFQETTSILTDISPTLGTDLDSLNGTHKPRVLIVDDDPDYVSMIKVILRQADFDVSGVIDYRAALDKCKELKPDVIILDLMMPEMDGYAVYKMLRNITNAPIMVVSAAPRSDHLFRALELGADDFVTKPFDNSEIVARLKKILRQAVHSTPKNVFYFPEVALHIDLEAREATLHGTAVRLLPREFSLLKILAVKAPHNVSYEKITQQIWGEDTQRTRAHLKTIAFGLRRKLEKDPARPRMLVNNRSIGYQLLTQP